MLRTVYPLDRLFRYPNMLYGPRWYWTFSVDTRLPSRGSYVTVERYTQDAGHIA